jgi:protein phosphatase
VIYLRPREDEDLQEEDSFDVSLPDGTLQIGNAQHMGRRSEQQDAFGFSDPADETAIEQKGLLAVVADGMGGMEKGASASNAAIQTLLDEHDRFDGTNPLPDWCRRAVGRANRSVVEIAEESGLAGEVGTTLSAVLVQGNQLHWVNVGDSRVYLARNDELTQLTDDHIYARELQEKVKEGDMSAEEAIHHPEREALTSYLGMPEMKHIDQNERPFRLQDGDRLLICSDGLYDALEDEQLQAALELSPQEACTALLQQVVGEAEEHQDNVTIMVLRYLDEGKTKSNDDD